MSEQKPPEEPAFVQLDPEALRARKRRNAWLAAALLAFVAIVGIATMVRIGEEATKPDKGLYYTVD